MQRLKSYKNIPTVNIKTRFKHETTNEVTPFDLKLPSLSVVRLTFLNMK